MQKKNKEFFTLSKTIVVLMIIVGTAVLSHINFFLNDTRPFVDHDAYYLCTIYFNAFSWLYDFVLTFLDKIFPSSDYNGFFVYKMLNLVYFIPLIIFTYLTAATVYSRGFGLLAAFFVMSYPDMLNTFHKSEINLMLAGCFSVCLYFYIKSSFLEKFYYSCLFFFSLFVFAWHHYSFVLYFNICLPVVCCIAIYRNKKNKRLNLKFIAMMVFVVVCFECALIFVFRWMLSGLFCSLFPAGIAFLLYKMSDSKRKWGWLIVLIAVVSLLVEKRLVEWYLKDLLYCIDYVKSQLLGVLGREPARYPSILSFLYIYLKRVFFFYRPSVFVFDFTFLNYAVCIGFYSIYILKQFSRKNNLSSLTVFEAGAMGMIFSGSLLMSFGVGDSLKFFTPFLVIMAVLNAGFFSRVYSLYGRFFQVKIFLFVLLGVLLTAGGFSLFAPNFLVTKTDSYNDFYYQMQDDYNIDVVRQCMREEDTTFSLEEIMFLNETGDVFRTSAFFSFWVKENFKLGKIRFWVNNRSPKYVVALYNFNAPVDLVQTDTYLQETIAKRLRLDTNKELSLRNIIAYGKKQSHPFGINGWNKIKMIHADSYIGKKSYLFPCREFLTFIYRIDS